MPFLLLEDWLLLGMARRLQHLHHIINHRLAHLLQEVRCPGVAIRMTRHGRVFCEQLGNVQQVGGVMQSVRQGNTAVNAEQRLVGVKGEGGDAEGG